jgi:hypothetical protein
VRDIEMFIATDCPLEENGQVGFRLCSDEKTMVLMCDECDAVWLRPDLIDLDHAIYPQQPHFLIGNENCSIKKPLSHWATQQEIEKCGWAEFIQREAKALDE